MIIWDGLNSEEERESNELDDSVKDLGTVETTRLLVDNYEEREHRREVILVRDVTHTFEFQDAQSTHTCVGGQSEH